MHMLTSLNVKNYKSIKAAEFQLSEFTPLVGCNNAGKTNLLSAIRWLMQGTKLSADCFYNPEDEIILSGVIVGIDQAVLESLEEKHRTKMEPLLAEGRLHIRRKQPIPNDDMPKPSFEVLNTSKDEPEWGAPPTGIEAAIKKLFPDPIFIGAMENATEDVAKFATSTTVGKLIREIVEPVTRRHSEDVSDALNGIAGKLSADGAEKDESLVQLDNRIDAELKRFFPSIRAKTHIPIPDFSDFIKGATIKLYDSDLQDDTGRDPATFGHGAQRSVQLALIRCLSEVRKELAGDENRTTLLLVDEPELYLHPQAIELVRASLKALSSEGYQVIFTTHSANMIKREDARNALLIKRSLEPDPKRVV